MGPERHFCTLFDQNYLLKAIVMIESLARHCNNAVIHVLCMDERTRRILNALDLPGVLMLSLSDVEDDALLRVKRSRSIAEYCWTLSSSLCLHVMEMRPEVGAITYVDADLVFFSNLDPIFDEIGEASIAIIEHRFKQELIDREVGYGRFNVQWVGFRRTSAGMSCLRHWRSQCIEWCFARLEVGRFGDQKYLDSWPNDFPGEVHIVANPGAGVAPWNYTEYVFHAIDDKIFVNSSPLVFYHFHQFQLLSGGRYDYMSAAYLDRTPIPFLIYRHYEVELSLVLGRVNSVEPGFDAGIRPASLVLARRFVQKFVPVAIKNTLRRIGVHSW